MKANKAKKNRVVPVIKESAQHIWLAGLGAFALAGEEGNRLFKSLVKKGEGMEKQNKARLAKVIHRAEDLRGDARGAVSRFTTPIESGMSTAMSRLGVPSRKEIALLTRRVEELTRVVERAKAKSGKRTSRRA